MVEKELNIGMVLIAGTITLVVMLSMFVLGSGLSRSKVESLERDVKEFNMERNSQEISRRMAENLPNKSCEALNIAVRQTVTDVRELQDKVTTYENKRKLMDDDFKMLKRQYTNLLLEYWLTTKRVEEMCGAETVKLLYLYSDEEECESCEDQGTILTHFRRKYDNKLFVFPLDTTLELRPVNLLTDAYSVEKFPAMIIEGKLYEGFRSKEDMRKILSEHMNTTLRGFDDE